MIFNTCLCIIPPMDIQCNLQMIIFNHSFTNSNKSLYKYIAVKSILLLLRVLFVSSISFNPVVYNL